MNRNREIPAFLSETLSLVRVPDGTAEGRVLGRLLEDPSPETATESLQTLAEAHGSAATAGTVPLLKGASLVLLDRPEEAVPFLRAAEDSASDASPAALNLIRFVGSLRALPRFVVPFAERAGIFWEKVANAAEGDARALSAAGLETLFRVTVFRGKAPDFRFSLSSGSVRPVLTLSPCGSRETGLLLLSAIRAAPAFLLRKLEIRLGVPEGGFPGDRRARGTRFFPGRLNGALPATIEVRSPRFAGMPEESVKKMAATALFSALGEARAMRFTRLLSTSVSPEGLREGELRSWLETKAGPDAWKKSSSLEEFLEEPVPYAAGAGIRGETLVPGLLGQVFEGSTSADLTFMASGAALLELELEGIHGRKGFAAAGKILQELRLAYPFDLVPLGREAGPETASLIFAALSPAPLDGIGEALLDADGIAGASLRRFTRPSPA